MEKKIIDQIEQSYVDNLNLLKSDGSIQDFSIKQTQITDDEIIFDVSILPVHGVRCIKTNITVTKDGVKFDEE